MIRHLILSVCLLLTTLFPVKAAFMDGIRIESPYQKIVVYVDGQKVCSPTFSCFVANLHGSCKVEVYAASSREENPRRENLLYEERVHCSINEIIDIYIPEDRRPGGGMLGQHKPNRPGHKPGGAIGHGQVMSPPAFEKFMELMKKQNFESDRKAVLDHALQTSFFTTDQCIRLLGLYNFNSEKKELMKKIYPRVVDKPNFYYVIDKLTFSSDKEEVNAFIRQYHDKNH